MPIEKIFSECDLVSNHVSSAAGQIIGEDLLRRLKKGAVVINTGSHVAFDIETLYKLLSVGKIRAAFDYPIKEDKRFDELPITTWFCSNANTAYNTVAANQKASDMATNSIINLLTTGRDQYRVN